MSSTPLTQVCAALDGLGELLETLAAKSPTLSVYARPRNFRKLTQWQLQMKGSQRDHPCRLG